MHLKILPNLALAATFLLAACGDSGAEDGAVEGTAADGSVEAGSDDVDLFAEENAAATETVPEPVRAYGDCPAGAFCEGPLLVRVDRLNLVPDGNRPYLSATFSVENRSNEDLRVIVMDEYATSSLDNGITLRSGRYPEGLEVCRDEGTDCFAAEPGRFRLIAPGDSPAKLTATLGAGSLDAQVMPSMREVATAPSISFKLFSVSASGDQRLHQVTIANAPVQNRMAE